MICKVQFLRHPRTGNNKVLDGLSINSSIQRYSTNQPTFQNLLIAMRTALFLRNALRFISISLVVRELDTWAVRADTQTIQPPTNQPSHQPTTSATNHSANQPLQPPTNQPLQPPTNHSSQLLQPLTNQATNKPLQPAFNQSSHQQTTPATNQSSHQQTTPATSKPHQPITNQATKPPPTTPATNNHSSQTLQPNQTLQQPTNHCTN